MTLEHFHFLRPAWLLLLPISLALAWWLRHPGGDLSAWQKIADERLLSYLTSGRGDSRRRWPLALAATAWVLAVLSLAGPVWDKRPLPLFRTEASRVVVLDLSRSMLAGDLKPNRLTQARYKLADLLDRTDEGQIGLVAFAAESFVVSPLTQDAGTIKAMLGALDVSIMPVQGSELGEALDLAGSLLERVGAEQGEVIVMTDSAGLGAVGAAERLRQAGHRLSVIGVGTPQGAPIPVPGGGFYKSSDGSIAVPRLDEATLAELAALGGGRYTRLRTDDQDLQAVLSLPPGSSTPAEDDDLASLQWREEGPWLVLLLVPLAALAFRRGWLLTGVLAVFIIQPPIAHADVEWQDPWLTPDQQAAKALEQEDWQSAARLAEDPALRATALYRAGEFDAAARAWEQVPGPEGHYNRGNALARLSQYDAAIEAYEEALSLDPEMEDALYNKELLEQMQQEQQQQEQQQQDQQQEEGDGEQQDSQSEEGEEEQQQDAEAQPEPQEGEEGEEQQQPVAAEELSDEEKQSLEQWLRRIPDDPGGLLRRKFLLEYQRRGQPPPETEEDW